MSDSQYTHAIASYKMAMSLKRDKENIHNNLFACYYGAVDKYYTPTPMSFQYSMGAAKAKEYIAEARKELNEYYKLVKDENYYTARLKMLDELEGRIK